MCGIVGWLNRDPAARVDEPRLRAMTRAVAHRGPDGEQVWLDGPAGLGHRRLAIIDPAGGGQPLFSEDRSLVLVCNGEIYNHVELRRELECRHVFRTGSDVEVILHLYEDLGARCVEKLNGMFAFALWDRRRRSLFLARDRFGIKPLYWTASSTHFAFASEIKALLAGGACPARLDDDGLAEYLTFQYTLGRRTLFRGVHRLEPATCLLFRPFAAAAPGIATYWSPSYDIDAGRSFEDFRGELLHLLEDSISLQLRSDVPVGAYLSGGTDSSVVVCLAARRRAAPIPVFCGAFDDGPEYDESAYARLVAAHCGAEYHETRPTADEFCRLMPHLVWLMDEPAAGPGLFPQYCVSRLAARNVRVCLGGQGGDELFGGYVRYLVAYLEQCLKGAVLGTGGSDGYVVNWQAIAPQLPMLRGYLPLLQHFWGDGLFEDMDRRYFRLIARDDGLEELLDPAAAGPARRQACFDSFRAIFHGSPARSYINRMTHVDLRTALPALLHVEDRASMGASLESRVPLLDHRIADLVTRMPPAMRFAGGRSKHVLREAVAGRVPRQVLDRRDKMGFPVPFNHWLKGPLRDFLRDTLLGTPARQRGLYRPAAIEDRVRRAPRFSREFWGLLCLELWFRRFIDRPALPPADVPAPVELAATGSRSTSADRSALPVRRISLSPAISR